MKPLRFYLTLFVLAAMTGFGVERASADPEDIAVPAGFQCRYDVGSSPRCQYCTGACMGTGWTCCRIPTTAGLAAPSLSPVPPDDLSPVPSDDS